MGFFNNVGLTAHYKLSECSSPSLAVSDFRRLIFAAAGDVIRKHRILFAIPVNEETSDTYFSSLPSIDLNRSIKFLKRAQPSAGGIEGEDRELDAILEDQHNTNFKLEYGILPFWRLIILQSPGEDKQFTASFIYHHAIGDGVSGLVFHSAFRSALDTASSYPSPESRDVEVVVPDGNTTVMPPLAELHPLPINPVPLSSSLANLKEWTGSSIYAPCKSRWTSLYLPPSTSKAFFQECKEKNMSITSVVTSMISTVLFSILPPTTEALTGIIPVNLRPWLQLPREVANGAIGTYFDATKVQFLRPEETFQGLGWENVWAGAQHVSRVMKGYLGNLSPSGEPYTTISFIETIPDISVIFNSMLGKPREAAFEVTNVGLFSSSAGATAENSLLWQVGKVMLSRSALVSGAAVTISVATGGNGSMTVGFSWQEGVLEDDVLHKVNQELKKYFEKYQ